MPSGTLVIIACNETDARIDPSRYFNLTASGNTKVVKTAGGRTESAINNLYAVDQATRIGCAWSPGDTEANVRSDISTLKSSPYVRNEIPIIGYVLDVATGQLKEVK
ncbi:hypothetical protein N0V90_007637 [Kalmusia sp. IMI 367209]|nr:hypothetical protein N0V90_007637 [Kalmusia sp. IMI 367209]